jgi:LmbE family N-acetylglucosaminyl deacetylase
VSDGAGLMADWGWMTDAELANVVVVSPHPDDAVLSCGQFLAAHPGATVVTVFAGAPETYPDPPSWWSTLCGFGPGDDITAARRAEDADALGSLGATPVWLDFLESQFTPNGDIPDAPTLAAALDATLRALDPSLILLPLGLANPEHVVTHDAMIRVREHWPAHDDGPAWLAYEDIAYKHIPGQLAWRVTKLFRSLVWPTPVAVPVDPTTDRKLAALARYPSQIRGLEADWQLQDRLDAPTPEQFWRLDPPPPGWEAMVELA